MKKVNTQGLITHFNEEPKGRVVGIARHGQTLLNKEDKIRSWLEVPLDETGFEEARELGDSILESREEWDGIITSDLTRSVQTSLEISKVTGIPLLETTKVLRPINVGEFAGKDGKKAHEIIMEHARNNPDEPIGGGESFNTFKWRMLGGIVGILNRNRGLKLILCTHSRGERLMFAWAMNDFDDNFEIDLEEFGRKGEPTASLQTVTITSNIILS